MDALQAYLISVCAAVVICGILTKLTEEKGTIGSLTKLLCGLFVLITVLSPIVKLPIYAFENYFDQLSMEAEYAASIGEIAAKEEIDQIVADRAKAYILERAADLGLALDVELVMQNNIPKSVRISGAVSPYTRHLLSDYISEHLGISVEEQQWIS